MANILVAGIYVADRPNSAAHIIYELAKSKRHSVEQRWIALAVDGNGCADLPCTYKVVTRARPKFPLLDELTEDASMFDWVVLCDDDIEMGPDFLDTLIHWADQCDFALAQPARSPDSFTDHPIVQQLPGVSARRTRFVEIGPVVCLRQDAIAHLMPFGAGIGMGWGLDFVWPAIMEQAGLKMGIVDAAPVAHRLRRPAVNYDWTKAFQAMSNTLAGSRHLKLVDSFSVLEIFV
ncbi:MAG: hypothetical protein EON54_05035 [Alcaligenaceae bacterium]|nr:MAG: hypothetical protein EON54_05035 [Alcaligenaceae bacterium]